MYCIRLERVGQEKSLGSPNVSVPGVRGPARVAEPEESDLDRVRGEVRLIALVADVVCLGVHR